MNDRASQSFAQVAVAAPVKNVFTYGIPDSLKSSLRPGHLVEVPFGRGTRRGVIVELADQAETGDLAIKPIHRLVEKQPVLRDGLIRTLAWASDYYLVPPGEMIFAALPPAFRKAARPIGAKRLQVVYAAEHVCADTIRGLETRAPLQARVLQHLLGRGEAGVATLCEVVPGARPALRSLGRKGLVVVSERDVARRPPGSSVPVPPPVLELTGEQQAAYDVVREALGQGGYQAFLLHGVTGSGKTEVYLRAIASALEAGRGAILLVPEIALTPQLLSRVSARFGDLVAVLHSGLSPGERLDEWRRLHSAEARVAVGARSAVFAPVTGLGLLIVDEEHDSSYKQSERIPYNGRDLAMLRAREERAVVILGTATPSVEAYEHAQQGRSRLLQLRERVQDRVMPVIEVVDLKEHLPDPIERIHTIGPRLSERLAETLDRGEQAILFLNRRGYSSFVLCKDCGRSIQCDNCSVALVHHKQDNLLRCHYCGLCMPVPRTCSLCDGGRVQLFGLGTEKCAEEVERRFPGARVIRLDSDSTQRRGRLQEMMERFARKEADVLVGTQMVTKGHDVPGVTLVGVLLADLSIHLPDFRAEERTFQLLVQVAGRAGRGDQPGRVVIQTFLPAHRIVALAREHRFSEFFDHELKRRAQLGYPPSKRILLVRLSHPAEDRVTQLAREAARTLRKESQGLAQVLGPARSPLARLRGRFRWQILVKAASAAHLRLMARALQKQLRVPPGAKIIFDVDPQDML